MKNILKNKKGISLMEILVGSLIFSLVAMTVTSVLAPMMMAFNRANSLAEYSTVLDAVGNQIANDIMRGTVVAVEADGEDNGYVMIHVRTEGTIEYRTALVDGVNVLQRRISPTPPNDFVSVFAPGFYRAKDVTFEVIPEDDIEQGFSIVVTVDSFNHRRRGAAGGEIIRTFAVRSMFTDTIDPPDDDDDD
ncbi:MAG: hypothetical protein LBC71_03850 [Oscillospiraceae bacterium]|jgi:hypothetical protein|nr:hypothetical protein [Oscillospiraceae bacterium]